MDSGTFSDNKKTVIGVSGVLALCVAMVPVYQTVASHEWATRDWVESRIERTLTNAPITAEAEYRIKPIEDSMIKMQHSMDEIRETMFDVRAKVNLIYEERRRQE